MKLGEEDKDREGNEGITGDGRESTGESGKKEISKRKKSQAKKLAGEKLIDKNREKKKENNKLKSSDKIFEIRGSGEKNFKVTVDDLRQKDDSVGTIGAKKWLGVEKK